MPARYEYHLEISNITPTAPLPLDGVLRHPAEADERILAVLMLDVYRGTIDYDGETLEDALNEVKSYFSAANNPLLDCSWLCFFDGALAGACLTAFRAKREVPIIAYIMSAAQWKNRGLARALLSNSLQSLAAKGYSKVHAVITDGNTPSEVIHARAGFVRVSN